MPSAVVNAVSLAIYPPLLVHMNSATVLLFCWHAGRPVDLSQLPDGSLLVSGDYEGIIYRIYYKQ
jgi:glucose/arabinose dehydrogenase